MTQITWPPSGGIHIHLNLAPPTVTPEPAPKLAAPVIDQLRVQAIDGQFQRINNWLAEYAPDEYRRPGDTADAIIAAVDRLRGQVARLQAMLAAADAAAYAAAEEGTRLRHDLETAIAERDDADSLLAKLANWLIQHGGAEGGGVDHAINVMASQAAEIKRLNADRSYATPRRRIKSSVAAALEAAPPTDQPEQYPPFIADAVEAAQAAAEAKPVQAAAVRHGWPPDDPELHDYIIGLDAGRHTWRTIPKPVRWRQVQAHLRSIWTDGKLPTMADFDATRPAWMPIATSIATTFGDGKWSVVCGKAVEA